MNIIPDLLFERDKLKEQIKKWKWLFFIALIILVIVVGKNSFSKTNRETIARIRIDGVMEYNPEQIKMLQEIEENNKIKALIVNINSPGGTAFAGEEIYVTLKQLSKKIPTVAVLETVAASGGYMAALGTDYIFARNMTITGSIGVIWQSFEAVEMANKLGIKFVAIKSSPLKAAPNPAEVITPEVKEVVMDTIDDNYQVFLRMLIESRKMKHEQAVKLADGRVYTGIRAKDLNLIDAIGGEAEALTWLQKEKQISPAAKIKDYDWKKKEDFFQELAKLFHNANAIFSQIFSVNNASILAY